LGLSSFSPVSLPILGRFRPSRVVIFERSHPENYPPNFLPDECFRRILAFLFVLSALRKKGISPPYQTRGISDFDLLWPIFSFLSLQCSPLRRLFSNSQGMGFWFIFRAILRTKIPSM